MDLREQMAQLWKGADGVAKSRQKRTLPFVMPHATFVIDDTYGLYMADPEGFAAFVQLLRNNAYLSENCKVIFLTSDMDCERVFREECMCMLFDIIHALLQCRACRFVCVHSLYHAVLWVIYGSLSWSN